MGEKARLAVSERDPGGDELIWTGATAPSTTKARKEQSGPWTHVYSSCRAVALKAKPRLLILDNKPHNAPACALGAPFSQSTNMHKHVFTYQGKGGGHGMCRVVKPQELCSKQRKEYLMLKL